MTEMKTELQKIQKEVINECTYTRKNMDDLSNRLTPRVNDLEKIMKDQLESAINKAVMQKLEHIDLEFVEDMIKKQINENKINDKITITIEEKLQDIKGTYETKIRDLRYELIGAHAAKLEKDQKAKDDTDQRIGIVLSAVNALAHDVSSECTTTQARISASHASLFREFDSRMAASSTGLSNAISDIEEKLKAGVHGGVNVDTKSFVKYTMDMNKNLTPGESSQETRGHSGNEAKHNTPTA